MNQHKIPFSISHTPKFLLLVVTCVSILAGQPVYAQAPETKSTSADRGNAAERIAQYSDPTDGKTDPHQLLPDAFRVPVSDILPIGNAEYSHSVDGKAWRSFRMWRLAETAKQPHRYFVWPVPQLSRNPKPLPELPDFVFAARPKDAQGKRKVQLQVELMSNEMLKLPALLDEIWAQDGNGPDSYLQTHAVKREQLMVSPFPVTHGFVEFTIGGEPALIAKTDGVLGAVPMAATIWVTLTDSQIGTLSDSMKDGTLQMTWRFQYTGTSPVMKANAQARMSAQMVTDAISGLTAQQQTGDMPVLDQQERDAVAQNVLSSMRMQTIANNPDALLFLNIDALLPKLFEQRLIEGDQLAKFVEDPARRVALAQYLVPHIQREETARGHNSARVVVDSKTTTHSAEGGGTFSVPLVGLSLGGDDAESEQVAHSVTDSTGITLQWNKSTSRFEATKIKTYFAKRFEGTSDQVVSQEIYVTKDPLNHFFYVVDSPVTMGPRSVYDELRLMATRRERWKSALVEFNRKWREGMVVQSVNYIPSSNAPFCPAWITIELDPDRAFQIAYCLLDYGPSEIENNKELNGKEFKGGWDVRLLVTSRDHDRPVIKSVEVVKSSIEFANTKKQNRDVVDVTSRPWHHDFIDTKGKKSSYDYWQLFYSANKAISENGDEAGSRRNDFQKIVKVQVGEGQQARSYLFECESPAGWNGNRFGEKLKNGLSIPIRNSDGRWTVKGEGDLFPADSEPPVWFK